MSMKQLCLVILSLVNFWMLSAQTYSVGDVYIAPDGSRGIVYYLFPDGTGGWVVALNDASTGCTWGENVDVPQLENFDAYYADFYEGDTACYTNTQILRNYQNNSGYAAGTVDFTNGWTLPTLRQLRALCSQMAFVSAPLLAEGGTAMAMSYYWTSVEYSSEKAWAVDFGGGYGGMYSSNKTESYRVRAVRSFSYLSSSATSNYSYSWSTGENTQDITVTPMETTTYTVTVTEAGGDVVGTGSVTIDVTCNGPEVTIITTDDTICLGDSVTLSVAGDTIVLPAVAVGNILCTDGTVVSPLDWPVAGKTAMGIVFHVDSTGEHGWAVHLQNQGSYKWASYGTDVTQLPNISFARVALQDLDGYTNTQILLNDAYCPAANAVDFANGWYLPALGQLNLIFAEMVTLNTSLQVVGGTQFYMDSDFHYWSSTECGYNWSWYLQYSGILDYCAKTYSHLVRSVRNF